MFCFWHFLITSIFKLCTLFLKWFPSFDSSPLHQFSKFNNFLWVHWFLDKKFLILYPRTWNSTWICVVILQTNKKLRGSYTDHTGKKGEKSRLRAFARTRAKNIKICVLTYVVCSSLYCKLLTQTALFVEVQPRNSELVKVSKSRKHFLEFSILPKNEQKRKKLS